MRLIIYFSVTILMLSTALAQTVENKYFTSLKWRCIGPHRGGRTVGAVGVPAQPNVFYIGVNNGGVWKTTDFGRTWKPIFDDQPTGSIGDVAVAPSNPSVVYAASGEGIQRPDLSTGDGVYKSADAGKTWINTGLKDGQQIGGLAIDPKNEAIVFAAVLGHPYGPNKERGVFRTTDGGKSWKNVLFIDENTGAVQVSVDPNNSNIVYADLWAGRQGPWENGRWSGLTSGLYKSTDGGNNWKQLTKGLPTTSQGLGRIGFCIAPSNSNRLYATVDAGDLGGIYRSDDAGETWLLINKDERYWGRGDDFAEVKADPQNADIVFTAGVVVWKSKDAGKTWNAFRGAPGGDDYHRIWINPNNREIILIASDQGAIITVNGGETFSSWYNQPTAQLYHVSTDNAFPYNVYSGQQESGSVGIASRGNDGGITYREWHPVGVEEYGYVAPDPMDNNIIYGGKITRYDKRTGQTQNIAPEAIRSGQYRFLRTAPVLFNPIDKKTLYYAGNVLFKTTNGGSSWETISPDLSRESWDIPASVGIYTKDDMKRMKRRGVIYTVAPSYIDINTIWCGTDDGLIHVTKDGGKTWTNVTPPQISSWSKISLMDASHTDANTAYAAVNRIRVDDLKAHIFKTTDGGKSWKEIVNGLPDDPINVIKEDPVKKGLLFAGSERSVYVSINDGENWQPLRLNMPATSIRDLVIKNDDIVIGTHGRSFWILDDITSLRQLMPDGTLTATNLFKPQKAIRVRWNMYPDTPVPQEEPAGENPPEGAGINYYLNSPAQKIELEIKDEAGKTIRKYSNTDSLYKLPDLNIPHYWIRPQEILSGAAGSHRFMWDMHYDPLNIPPSYPISATYMNTAPNETSPWVLPGTYTVKLTVDGKEFIQTFQVVMDPRVTTSHKDLLDINRLAVESYEKRKVCLDALNQISFLRQQIKQYLPMAAKRAAKDLNMADSILNLAENGSTEPGFGKLQNDFAGLFNLVNENDMPVTRQAAPAVDKAAKELDSLQLKWTEAKEKLKKLNSSLPKTNRLIFSL